MVSCEAMHLMIPSMCDILTQVCGADYFCFSSPPHPGDVLLFIFCAGSAMDLFRIYSGFHCFFIPDSYSCSDGIGQCGACHIRNCGMHSFWSYYVAVDLHFLLFQAGGPKDLYAEHTDVRGAAMFINHLRIKNRQVLSRFGTLLQQRWTAGHSIPQEVSQLWLTCASDVSGTIRLSPLYPCVFGWAYFIPYGVDAMLGLLSLPFWYSGFWYFNFSGIMWTMEVVDIHMPVLVCNRCHFTDLRLCVMIQWLQYLSPVYCCLDRGRNIHGDFRIDMLRWRRFDSTCHRHVLDELWCTNGACQTQDEWISDISHGPRKVCIHPFAFAFSCCVILVCIYLWYIYKYIYIYVRYGMLRSAAAPVCVSVGKQCFERSDALDLS